MIEIAMTNGKISIRSFAEAHGLGEWAATSRLQRAVKNGEMVRERNGRNVTYYYKNSNRIKAHDPFNLCGGGR